MKRGAQLSATFLTLALLSACSAPKEAEAPTDTASAESDEVIKQEAKSIEAAANEAAALVEAEANAESDLTHRWRTGGGSRISLFCSFYPIKAKIIMHRLSRYIIKALCQILRRTAPRPYRAHGVNSLSNFI
jgi:hypothetical protein